jgi:hypothetical protein
MPKVEVEIAKKILERREVPVCQRNEILQDIKHVLEQEAIEKDMKPKAPKKEFVVIVSDPKGVLKAAYPEGVVGWVVQVEEGEAPQSALARLHQSAYNHNASHKGRKFPVETIGEACETLSAKTTKEHKVWIKTKEAVLVIPTENQIPKPPACSQD